MGKSLHYFLFLLLLCYLIVSSILLFTGGFLLTRDVQKTNATCLSYRDIPCDQGQSRLLNSVQDPDEECSQNEKIISILSNNINSASNVCLPPKARAILLIVDALRYDFTVYNEKNKKPLPFQNKLPVIHSLLKLYPDSTRLYKFIADPPTTTLQRLKALTTGSLPTFIDAGSNFATSEINEDNIVDQLIRNNHKVVFMGDDTWEGLYPNRFTRNYSYPSFNVKDLDTVDNGVRENLYPELKNTDWSLLIGHFLGVDHCGHRYGPNHSEMERKLGEINTVIKNVVEQIDDNTMLFVIGDHGMTVTGDHGGESDDEITAALFVYSKHQLSNLGEDTSTVKQVDLVPTLSTILGIPTPFQNLGKIILNCLPMSNITTDSDDWRLAFYALWSNVQQVSDYINAYSQSKDTFKKELLSDFHKKFSALNETIPSVNNEESFKEFSKELMMFLSSLRKMCEDVWVQFEPFLMARGLLIMFMSMFFVFLIIDGIPAHKLPAIIIDSFLFFTSIVLGLAALTGYLLYIFGITGNLLSMVFFLTGVASLIVLSIIVIQNWENISLNWYEKSKTHRLQNIICRLVMVLNLSGLFSNSYIIEECYVLLYLLVAVILLGSLGIASSYTRKRGNITTTAMKWPKLKLFLFVAATAVLVRSTMYFWRCREEQKWCFAFPHEVNNITAKTEASKEQWAITVVCLTLFVFATKEWLKSCGNLNGYSITVTLAKFIPTVIVVCIAGFWVMKKLPTTKKQTDPLKSVNTLALAVYGLTFLGISVTLFKPLCTYLLFRTDGTTSLTEENIIPRLFKKIRGSIGARQRSNDDIPIICGLGTVYSSVFIIIGIYLTLLFGLLLGDRVAPSAVIMFITAAFILIVTSILRIEKAKSIDQLFDIPNLSILAWIILSQYFFYASGHQPAFPNISWEAAFVGTTGIFSNNFVPGALIIINTFCSYILMGVLLPLLLITPFTVFVMLPSALGKKPEFQVVLTRGEVILFEKDDIMITSMFTLSCKYIMGHGIRVFASMLSATIHCRHLMVWKIFAPKLIFESIGILVTLVSVMVGYLVLVRINKQVENLVIKLNKMS